MYKRKEPLIAVAIVTGALLSGCATIVSGSDQTVAISSEPSAADVVVRDETDAVVFSNKTPASVTLKKGKGYFKKKSYVVEISKEGYETQAVQLTGSANGWYVGGNLLFGGLIGYLIVDPLTGAMYTLNPKEVNTDLPSLSADRNVLEPDRISVVLLEDMPTQLHGALHRVR